MMVVDAVISTLQIWFDPNLEQAPPQPVNTYPEIGVSKNEYVNPVLWLPEHPPPVGTPATMAQLTSVGSDDTEPLPVPVTLTVTGDP